MRSLILYSLLQTVCTAAPLLLNSLITIRSINPPPSGGGNTAPITYKPLIIEEWDTQNNYQLHQQWILPERNDPISGIRACTLPGLSNEFAYEGRMLPRYPYGDQLWFLCRNVNANSSYSINPAPLNYAYINEDGNFNIWAEEPTTYLNATTTWTVVAIEDQVNNQNIFYTLGGGTTTIPLVANKPRIRIDSGPGLPPDLSGPLLGNIPGLTIQQFGILNNTLYGLGLQAGGSGTAGKIDVFQIGDQGVYPNTVRNSAIAQGFGITLLSAFTYPWDTSIWFSSLIRTPTLGVHNITANTTLLFAPPPSSTSGSLGANFWRVLSGQGEGDNFILFIGNLSHIYQNSYANIKNNLPFSQVLQAPNGWRYLSAHARELRLPSPSPTASTTSTSSSSASATSTSSSSASATSTSSASSTATSTSTSTPTSGATSTSAPSTTPSPSSTASWSAQPSASASASATSTESFNKTGPLPLPSFEPASNSASELSQPGPAFGISVAVFALAGGLLYMALWKIPFLKSWTTSKLGIKGSKKSPSLRAPRPTKMTSNPHVIEISHNPSLSIRRIDQLKAFNAISNETYKPNLERNKKVFLPQTTSEILGESV